MSKVLLTEGKTSEHVNKRCGCQPKEELQTSRSVPKDQPLTSQLEKPTVTQTSRILASSVLESEQLSKGPLYDDDDIDHDKTDTFKPSSKPRIRNTKYEIRNTKYEKQKTKQEVRNTKFEIRNTEYLPIQLVH